MNSNYLQKQRSLKNLIIYFLFLSLIALSKCQPDNPEESDTALRRIFKICRRLSRIKEGIRLFKDSSAIIYKRYDIKRNLNSSCKWILFHSCF